MKGSRGEETEVSPLLSNFVMSVEEDCNNNEVITRSGFLSFKKTLIVLLSLGFIGSVAAIGVATSVKENKLERLEGKWAPFLPKPNPSDVAKLRRIRELSPFPVPSDITKEAVCYTTECLDASLNLLQSMNFSVDPCDNFFQYSCGRWLAENEIPSSSSRWSQFNILRDQVNNITQEILASDPDASDFPSVANAKNFYKSCIDLAALEQASLGLVLAKSEEQGRWPAITPDWTDTDWDLVTILANIRRIYASTVIVRAFVSQDFKDTTRSVVHLDQPSFFLSRAALLDHETYKAQIDATRQYFVDVAIEIATFNNVSPMPTVEELGAQANDMINFESELAKISSVEEDRTNVTRIYNLRKLDAYEQENAFKWKAFLDQLFSTSGVAIAADEDIVVFELDYMTKLLPILNATDNKVIANYVQWRLISGLIGETTNKMREIKFAFDKASSGLAQPATRENSCAGTALNIFGMAIGVKYVEAAFDVSAKENVDAMVGQLRGSFGQILVEADWLSEETKVRAAEKAASMRQFMAFPDWLNNETRLEQEYTGAALAASHLQSIIDLSHWSGDKALKELRKVTDKDYWLTYPGVVNAFYSPEFNSITFPAGILAPPFYRSNGPESINYGGIGVVIGHEITHGFDDQGSQYDANGNAENWWSEQDLLAFKEKAQCIVDQYSGYTVETDVGQLHVNGDLTSGENIADNGGISESFAAYQKWIEESNEGVPEKRLPGLETISPDQLFFLGFANIWCENITPQALTNQINNDPHSPARFRVIGPLQNSQIFADKWQCPSGSFMNPTNKCHLW